MIARVKNNPRIHIPIFGNGDIDSPEKALIYKNRYGVDGIMIGRGGHRLSLDIPGDQIFPADGELSAVSFSGKNASM
ncbi:MAG: tRNA-dihydrouridine synthase [Puia sp.]